MKFAFAALLAVVVLLGIAYIVSPLRTFNALVPKDAGSQLVARDQSYGPSARQQLDIYTPATSARTAHRANVQGRPVIIFFYGGSWNSGTRHGYDFVGRALASQGFIVVIPDYRLVPQVRFPGFVEDGAAAVRWVRANIGEYGGDPQRIVLAGHSAGAHIAAMLAFDEQWLREDQANIAGFMGLAGPYDFYPFTSEAAHAAFDAWPDPTETQPVTFVAEGAPPALLLTGEEDSTVRPRNSEALAARLREAGSPVQVERYRDVAHIDILLALSRPFRDRAPVLQDMVRFAGEVANAAPAQD